MILVVGDVMLDRYFWGVATKLSAEAPVPIVKVQEVTTTLGGAGNVAANLVGLRNEVVLVGACGKDQVAESLTQIIREFGITDYLVAEKDRITTTKTRVIADRQQIVRIDEEVTRQLYAAGRKSIRNNIRKVLPKCKAVIISDYAKGVVDDSLVEDIMEIVHIDLLKVKGDLPVFVDPKGVMWKKYEGVYCITPNLKEFVAFWHSHIHKFKTKSIETETKLRTAILEAVEMLSLEYMVVTRGHAGILVVPAKGKMHQLDVTTIREVIDVSGAGDTVIATLASQTARGGRMEDCAWYANKMAGLVVCRLGTSPVRREEAPDVTFGV